jgi:hypothetical protein
VQALAFRGDVLARVGSDRFAKERGEFWVTLQQIAPGACKSRLPWAFGFDQMSFPMPDAARATLSERERWPAAGGKQFVINALVEQRDFAAMGGLTGQMLGFLAPVC